MKLRKNVELPDGFCEKTVKRVLAGETTFIIRAFDWSSDSHGWSYWMKIYNDAKRGYDLPDKARRYLLSFFQPDNPRCEHPRYNKFISLSKNCTGKRQKRMYRKANKIMRRCLQDKTF